MSNHSPVVFALHSRDFLEAARRESLIASTSVSMPAYFLAARAIELGLKSYLLLVGKTEAELRKIGHNLGRALDVAKAEGLEAEVRLSPEAEQAVRWINEYYQQKDLEYPKTGYKSYPQISYLIEFADLLHTSLESRRRKWRPVTA